MNLKKGEIWICKEPYFAAEIEVLRGAESSCHGNFTVRCCCGKEMTRKERAAIAEKREPVAVGRAGRK